MSSGLASARTRLKVGWASPSSVTAKGVPSWTADAPRAKRARILSVAVDAAGGDQGDLGAIDAHFVEEFEDAGEDGFEVEAGVVEVFELGGAEVSAGEEGVFDDDGVWQAVFAGPFFEDDGDASDVGQDGDEGDVGEVGHEVGEVQGQAGADDEGICAALAGLAGRVRRTGRQAHDVDGDEAVAVGEVAGRP